MLAADANCYTELASAHNLFPFSIYNQYYATKCNCKSVCSAVNADDYVIRIVCVCVRRHIRQQQQDEKSSQFSPPLYFLRHSMILICWQLTANILQGVLSFEYVCVCLSVCVPTCSPIRFFMNRYYFLGIEIPKCKVTALVQ